MSKDCSDAVAAEAFTVGWLAVDFVLLPLVEPVDWDEFDEPVPEDAVVWLVEPDEPVAVWLDPVVPVLPDDDGDEDDVFDDDVPDDVEPLDEDD